MLSQHESEILNDLDQRLSFLSGSALPSALRVANFQNKKDSIKESLWDQGRHVQKLWATFRLHPEVNNVENNPGPAVFDNTNPATPVSAGHRSNNLQKHTLLNVGKQCTVCCK